MKYTIFKTISLCFIILSTSILVLPISNAVQTELNPDQFEAIFTPIEAGTQIDIDDIESIPTGYDKWTDDFGEEMPEGIFLGSAIAPSVLDTGYRQTYQNTYLELQQNVQFTSTELINGCSEFWIRLPIIWDDYLHDTVFDRLDVLINEERATSINTIQLGSSLYMKMHHIIVPDIVYRFKFLLGLNYWGITDVAANGFYKDVTALIEITGDNLVNSTGTASYSLLTKAVDEDPWDGLEPYDSSPLTTRSNITLPYGATFSTSFLFTKGMGQGGLFGRNYRILGNPDIYPLTFPSHYSRFKFQTELPYDASVSSGYLSIMIPFSSIHPVTLLWASFELEEGSISYSGNDYMNMNFDYEGFFLFTFPNAMTFTSTENAIFTIQLSVRSAEYDEGSISFLHNSVKTDYMDNFYMHDPSCQSSVYWDNLDKDELVQNHYYSLVSYASLTNGQWTYVVPTQNNNEFQYTKVFRSKIYVTVTKYELLKENADGSTTTVYSGYNRTEYDDYLLEYGVIGFDKPSGPFSSLGEHFVNAIKAIWDGSKIMYGYIIDGIQKLGEALYKLGEVTVNSFLKLEKIIKSIKAFLSDNLVGILELIFLMVAPLLVLFVIVYTCKPLNNAISKRGADA